jgi:hypothetical protein
MGWADQNELDPSKTNCFEPIEGQDIGDRKTTTCG